MLCHGRTVTFVMSPGLSAHSSSHFTDNCTVYDVQMIISEEIVSSALELQTKLREDFTITDFNLTACLPLPYDLSVGIPILIYPQYICTAVTIQQHCKKSAFKPKRGHESTTGIHLIDE